MPDFDERQDQSAATGGAATRDQRLAAQRLQSQAPEARVEFDPLTGAPKSVSAGAGFLSGAHGQGKAISTRAAGQFAADEPHRATKAFLLEHRLLFGHGPEVLDQARVRRDFVTPRSGLRTMVWEQHVDGIPIFDSVLISHTTRRGELVSLSSRFLADPVAAADHGSPNRAARPAHPEISARRAVAVAASNIGEQISEDAIFPEKEHRQSAGPGPEQRQRFRADALRGTAEARRVWKPMAKDQLRLCWDVILMGRSRSEMYRVLVDAQTGRPLLRRCLTVNISDATYRVFTGASPAPLSPGYSTPTSQQPPLVQRTLVTLSALNTNASPKGWIDDGSNETLGNNVDAHTDWNGDDVPDLPRPHGSPSRVFDFPLDLSQAPSHYSDAAVVQLFYWCNWMHDKLYELGFTEAAGNFQDDNLGRGGLGGDAVQADAQDGQGVDNANFSTPPDGLPGRMQMFVFSQPNPPRDGDLDAQVILHEYTHGLSNRRVGGGVGMWASQSQGMGEGWSDFYALALLSNADDDVDGVYPLAAYVSYRLGGQNQNYYFGIRRYPYCTDMSKNPLTFKDIDPRQAASHPGVPRSTVIGGSPDEVHNMGEVWCAALWEARASLIRRYGGATGNQLILQLVTDGMNLAPPNPDFLQARDAILQADQVDTGGANLSLLWAAFAKRGMGFEATCPDSFQTIGVSESLDVPDDLRVSPRDGLSFSSLTDGPVNPACQVFWLSNLGSNTLDWAALPAADWFTVLPEAGTLEPGTSNAVTLYLTDAVNWLTGTNYAASIVFSNAASGVVRTRTVALTLTPPRVLFFPLDTDPGWTCEGEWAFGVPEGQGGWENGYPDPVAGATGANVFGINLAGDYATTAYAPSYPTAYAPSYLTAGPFDLSGYSGTRLQFKRWLNTDSQPFVSATIDLSTDGVNWVHIWTNGLSEITDDSWRSVSCDISAFADNGANVFVRWGHEVVSPLAFPYSGWNLDDIEIVGTPTHTLTLSLPQTGTEGDEILGSVAVAPVFSSDLSVTLVSSDPSSARVPSFVTIPAGQSNVTFSLTLVDDGLLNGPRTVSIKGSAPQCKSGRSDILVLDNLNVVDHFSWETVSSPQEVGQPFTISLTARNAYDQVVDNFSGTVGLRLLGGSQPASMVGGPTNAVLWPTNSGNFEAGRWTGLISVLIPVSNATLEANDGATHSGLSNPFSIILTNDIAIAASASPDPVAVGANLMYSLVISNFGIKDATGVVITNILPDAATFLSATASQGACTQSNGVVTCDLGLLPGGTQAVITITIVPTTAGILVTNFATVSRAETDPYPANNSVAVVTAVEAAPLIVTQPTNQVVLVGGMASLAVLATGTEPLSYQWSFNGTNLPSATDALLVLGDVQRSDAGLYAVLVSNAVGAVLSSNALLTVQEPAVAPTIIEQPTNQVVLVGGMASFSVVATGTEPMSYQWSFNGTNLPSATDASLVLTNAQWNDAGIYAVLVTNSAGAVLSSNALLTMHEPAVAPTIIEQPTNQVVLLGGMANFSVVAVGTEPLSYQWSFNGTNLPSATDASLVLTNAQWSDAGLYAVLVTNSAGGVLSSNALLAVQEPAVAPTIIEHPTNQMVLVGGMASFSVVAAGTEPLSYQWSFNGTNLPSATDALLVLTNAQWSNAGIYAVLVTNSAGAVLSSNALLTVQAPAVAPTIIEQPTNQVVLVGGMVSFAVLAAGTEPLSYQWSFNGTNLASATDALLVLTNAHWSDAGIYAVLVSNSAGAVLSSNALLMVQEPAVAPTIIEQPTNQVALVGGMASFSVVAVGTEPMSYQWSFNGTDLPSATDASLVLTNVQWNDAGLYAVLVTNSAGAVLSSNALLAVQEPAVAPTIIEQPTNQVVLVGGMVSFAVLVTGTEPLSYQWSFNGTNLPAATDALLVLTNVQWNDAGLYAVLVTNSAGAVLSSNALLTVQEPALAPTIIEQPTNQVVLGGGMASFSVVVTGTEPLSYQWSFNGTNLPSATDASLLLTNAQWSDAGLYAVLVTNSAGAVLSSNALLRVQEPTLAPTIIEQPTNQVVLIGGMANFSVVVTGTEPMSYQWSFNGTNLPSATDALLVLTNVQWSDAGIYAVLVTNSAGAVLSSNALLAVQEPAVAPVILEQPTNQVVLGGGMANFSVVVTGTEPMSYQWSFNGTNLPSATDALLVLTNAQWSDAGIYAVLVTNSAGAVLSSNALLTVQEPAVAPTIIEQPTNQVVLVGRMAGFTLLATGTEPMSYQWSLNGTNLLSATDALLVLTNAQWSDAGLYAVLVSNSAGAVLSSNALLTVQEPAVVPVIVEQPTNQVVLIGGMASFSVVAAGAEPLSYQWSVNGTNLPSATDALLVLTNVQWSDAGLYAVLVTNSAGAVLSSNALLTVQEPAVAPTIIEQPTNQVVLVGGMASFSVVAAGTEPMSYQWSFNGTNLPSATDASLVLTNAQWSDTGLYAVLVTNSAGAVLSSNALLMVQEPAVAPTIIEQPTNQVVLVGGMASFSVVAAGTEPLSYQWSFNGTNLPSATDALLVLTNAQWSDAGIYAVLVTNSAGAVLSSNALLTVQEPAVAPVIIEQPTNQVVLIGGMASFSVVAAGTEPLSYQWSFNGTNLPSATDASLVLTNVQWSDAGIYAVLVTNTAGAVLSSNALLTIQEPAVAPTIIEQPTNQVVLVGGMASFSVVAAGTEPMSYQWSFNGTNLASATDALLVLTNAQWSDAGIYAVLVSNAVGAVLSSNALLTVQEPAVAPTIIEQPTNQVVLVGGMASFSVVATGTEPMSYQWSFNGTNLPSATDALLVLTNAQWSDAGLYAVVVANTAGAVLSSNALLTMQEPAVAPTILEQPTNQVVLIGGMASFSVVVTGTEPMSYQWSFNGTNLPSATDALLVLTNAQWSDAGIYAVLVTNSAGAVLSSNALLTVQEPAVAPTILEHPTNQVVLVGGMAIFSVVAAGTEPMSYQWSFNGTNLPSATDASLVLTNAQWSDAGLYAVLVTNSAGAVLSSNALLTVQEPAVAPTILEQPTNQVVLVGGMASFAILATGTEPMSYQWSFNGTNLPSATDALLVLTNAQWSDAGLYAVLVTNSAGAVLSSNALLTVQEPAVAPTIIEQPTNQVVLVGRMAGFTLLATGTEPMSYQWSFNGTNLPSATDASLVLTNAQWSDAGLYAVLVSNSAGAVLSSNALLTVQEPAVAPTIIEQPTNQVVLVGGMASFSVVVTGTEPLSYQWSFNGTNLPSATDALLVLTNVQWSDAGIYAVLVTNSAGAVLSSNALLTVQEPAVAPTIIEQPTNQVVLVGRMAGFTLLATGTEPMSYQWSFNGTNLPAATDALLVLTNVQWNDAGLYAVLVSNSAGAVLSSNALLTVQEPALAPTIIEQPTNQVVLVGGMASFSVVVTGTEPLSYQWSFNGTNLPSATDALLVLTNVQWSDAGLYAVLVTNSAGAVLSSNALLTVQEPAVAPTIIEQPTNQVVLIGGMASFAVLATGTEPLSYQWSLNGTNLPSATDASLVLTNAQWSDAGLYAVLVTNSAGAVLSSNALLTVQEPAMAPTILEQPTNQVVLVGGMAIFSVVAAGTEPMSYQWSLNGTNLPSATDASLVLTNVQWSDAGLYAVLVTNSAGAVLSSNALLTVQEPAVAPTIIEQPTNQVVLVGGMVSFAVLATGTEPMSYQWSFNGTNLPSATDALLVLTNAQWSDAGIYAVLVTNSAGAALSSNALLTVQEPAVAPTIIEQPTNQVVLIGGAATFSVVATGTEPLSYQWSFNGTNLPSATDALLVLTNVQWSDAGLYAVLVTNSAGAVLSSNALLAVQEPAVAPTIIEQPTNQVVLIGGMASFSVVATGTEPLSYQWSFNGTNLPSATDALLVLTNVQSSDAGTYAVLVSNSAGAVLSSNALLGVCALDHFVWDPVPSPRVVNTPFVVRIQAQDVNNQPETNFQGTVTIRSLNGIPVSPAVSGNFVDGSWTGAVVVSEVASNTVLVAEDGAGHIGLANAVDVIAAPQLSLERIGQTIIISWPGEMSGFVLESSPDLSYETWVQVTTSVYLLDGKYQTRLRVSSASAFYRLRLVEP